MPVSTRTKPLTSYIIDTVKTGGKYLPGALTYTGRKRMEVLRWDVPCASEEEATAFVRGHFAPLGIPEASNEGELRSIER